MRVHSLALAAVAILSPSLVLAKPIISEVSYPSTGAAGSPISLSASVNSSISLQSCNLYIDSDDKGAMTISGNLASLPYTFQYAGVYTAFVFCRDTVGGIASGPNTSVYIKSGPTRSTEPYNGGSSGSGSSPSIPAPVTPTSSQTQTQTQTQAQTAISPIEGLSFGSLLKVACPADAGVDHPCKSVYYYGKDGKRHAFANDKVFFSWYSNFDSVVTISPEVMGKMLLGKNVTYRPGSRMVKFTTLNKVYAIAQGGSLRWVTSEAVASALYGADWNKKIDDLPDTVYLDYHFGVDITEASQYNLNGELNSAVNIDASL